jgi:hypothetical protein
MGEQKSFRQASEVDLMRMGRDHATWGDWRIMTDGYRVWLAQQALGHAPTRHIEVPKGIFDRLIDAYVKPRPLRAKAPR